MSMSYFSEQWRQDKLHCVLVACWLLTVASSFFNSYLFPVELPGIGTWFAFRTFLPLTALLYVFYAARTRTFFWKDSTSLERWCYVFIAVLLLYGAASLPRALDVSWTFRRLFNLCFDLCFFFLMLRLCRQKDIRKLTLTVCFVLWIVMMLLGVYEIFNGGIVDAKYDDLKRFYVLNELCQFPVVFAGNTNDYGSMLTFFYGVFLLARREFHLPGWVTVILTAATYFLLLSTSSRICIFAFYILLAAQLIFAVCSHQKVARRSMAWIILCVCCVQFVTQYRYIVPPIQSYLAQRAAYEESSKSQASGISGEEPLEKPELHLGDSSKESLNDQFFHTDEATGKKELRTEGSAGMRAHLLLHAFQCFIESHGLGIGLGNTETLAARRVIVPEWAGAPQNSIHCFLMRITADYGIFVLIPLCAIAFLLIKQTVSVLLTGLKRKDRQTLLDALLFFAVLLIYPIVSTASSDAQDMIPMWIYLGLLVLYAAELSLQKARSQSSEAFRFSSKKSLYA